MIYKLCSGGLNLGQVSSDEWALARPDMSLALQPLLLCPFSQVCPPFCIVCICMIPPFLGSFINSFFVFLLFGFSPELNWARCETLIN
jgi:hypothetical protein